MIDIDKKSGARIVVLHGGGSCLFETQCDALLYHLCRPGGVSLMEATRGLYPYGNPFKTGTYIAAFHRRLTDIKNQLNGTDRHVVSKWEKGNSGTPYKRYWIKKRK